MTNTSFQSPEELRDIEALNRYRELAATPGLSREEAFELAAWGCRDHARTPMQWSREPGAGFTTGAPWLKLNPNYPAINAENQMDNPDSVLGFHKTLIALRRAHEALVYGEFSPVFLRDANTLCYFRTGGGEKFYVEINLTGDEQKRPGPLTAGHRLLAANYGGVARHLRPYEANVYSVGTPSEE